jgi:hypothetical protein
MNDEQLLLVVGIIILVMLVFNVVFLAIIFLIRRKVAAVSQWPATIGSIIASYLDRRFTGKSRTNYPVVHYVDQVSRQQYQGRKIAPGPEVGGSGAEKVVARYPVGARVMVFYNPQDPADAVLERKALASWMQWVLLLLLALFDVIFCIVIPVLLIRMSL